MRHSTVAAAVAAGLILAGTGPAAAAGTASAVLVGQGEVDTSTLVPELFPGYDWDCRIVAGAPVCRGELHHDPTPVVVDDVCESPFVWNVEGVRYSTRHYGADNRLQWRTGRVHEVERSSRMDGTAHIEYRVNTRYTTTYDVPGDVGTATQVTNGSLWDFRTDDGRIILRTVGTLVEPHDGDATFTGSVNREGTVTRVVDAPLAEVFDEQWLFGELCAHVDG